MSRYSGVWDLRSAGVAVETANTGVVPGSFPEPTRGHAYNVERGITSIYKYSFTTQGEVSDFGGDVSSSGGSGTGLGNLARGVYVLGGNTSSEVIEYITYASAGDAVDFGDLAQPRYATHMGQCGNHYRGFIMAGLPSGYVNTVETIHFHSQGHDSVDFGDLTSTTGWCAGLSDSTRAIRAAGNSSNVIDYATITTRGNFTDFGDATASGRVRGMNSATRGLWTGNQTNYTAVIDYITIQTTGNAADFGDLFVDQFATNGQGSGGLDGEHGVGIGNTASCFDIGLTMGGNTSSSSTNNISHAMIGRIHTHTLGSAHDFGDVHKEGPQGAGCVSSGFPGAFSDSIAMLGSSTAFIFMGGNSWDDRIDIFNVTINSDATDFSDLRVRVAYLGHGSCGSKTRALIHGGYQSSSDSDNGLNWGAQEISYLEFSHGGLTAEFGDDYNGYYRTCISNTTRGISMGGRYNTGYSFTQRNTIEYVTIASVGNGTDFGDLQGSLGYAGGGANATRGIHWGGYGTISGTTSGIEDIVYITIASTGDVSDFGDLDQATKRTPGACGNSTRLVKTGGAVSATNAPIAGMQYITIATTGDSSDFGDMDTATYYLATCDNGVTGVSLGGKNSSHSNQDRMETITIASTGNGTDFANLSSANSSHSSVCNSNGSLIT